MGYTTDFDGAFAVFPFLQENHRNYINAFSNTRRMSRNAEITATYPDPIREAVGLPIGPEGAYYVGGGDGVPRSGGTPMLDIMGQARTPDILDYNSPPTGQPELWCQWEANSDGSRILWNGTEKFYSYTEWLAYLIEHFLAPWGYKLNGTVVWQGEDHSDFGKITVIDNQITTFRGIKVYEENT